MNKTAAWPVALRLIHWLSAALVLGMLALGTIMVQLVADPAQRFDLTQTHKSFGIAVLALTVARLCLRLCSVAPPAEPASRSLLIAAKATHIGLYALLLLMPLSGWLMVSTTPVRVPTEVFGLFTLPYPLAPDIVLYRIAHAIHVGLAIVLAGLIALHLGAALLHALWWRDRTLARMWRARRAERHARSSLSSNQFHIVAAPSDR